MDANSVSTIGPPQGSIGQFLADQNGMMQGVGALYLPEFQIGFYNHTVHAAVTRKSLNVAIANKFSIDVGGDPENLPNESLARVLQDAWNQGRFPKEPDQTDEIAGLRTDAEELRSQMSAMMAELKQLREGENEPQYGPIPRFQNDAAEAELLEAPDTSTSETITGLGWNELRKLATDNGVKVNNEGRPGMRPRDEIEAALIAKLEMEAE